MNQNMNSHKQITALCECSVMIAAAQVLGYLKLFRLPNGGSITLNMLPIFVICIRWGAAYGFASGAVFGLLQLVLDGGIGLGWESIFGDYLIAYTVLGTAGLIRANTLGKANLSVMTGSLARYAVAVIVGAVVWGKYMPDSFWGMPMNDPWIYSLLYNASYILPAMALCMIIVSVLWHPMKKYLHSMYEKTYFTK